jgi:hypothetical protein
MVFLIFIGIFFFIIIISKIIGTISNYHELQKKNNEFQNNFNDYRNRILENNKKLEQIEKENNELKKREITHNEWIIKQNQIRENLLNEIDNYLSDREKAYKWLSPLIADAKLILKEKARDPSKLVTSKRSYETMARVANLMQEIKVLTEENIILKYQLEYIKTLIPEVDNIVEYDEYYNDSLEVDSPKNFLSKEEYNQLSDTEKNIRALDYYKKRKKRNWEIGRDFERYIGYLYEKEGYKVEYFGIEMKLNDLGRDLIVEDESKVIIIQCKYWSKQKIIYEKHICQLYGTIIKYKIDNQNENRQIMGLFITHTTVSNEARLFAKALDIEITENVELGEYPIIKCNNGKDGYGNKTKIYHLPMDQQYDNTIIEKEKGDFYAFSIQEAEEQGYRRAYKWHGN